MHNPTPSRRRNRPKRSVEPHSRLSNDASSCATPHMLAMLQPAPQWSEQRSRPSPRQVAQHGGPEATIIVWTNRGQATTASPPPSARAPRRCATSWTRRCSQLAAGDHELEPRRRLDLAPGRHPHAAPGTASAGPPAPGIARRPTASRAPAASPSAAATTPPTPTTSTAGSPTPPLRQRRVHRDDHQRLRGRDDDGGDWTSSRSSPSSSRTCWASSATNNAGGGFKVTGWNTSCTNTGIPDNAEGGGNGMFWVFDGPTVDHLMTSFNSGDPKPTSWGNVVHTAGPAANITFGGRTSAAARTPATRSTGRSDTSPASPWRTSSRDAYGYTIAEPMTFGTFHAVLNETTGRLTIRGGPAAAATTRSSSRSSTAARSACQRGRRQRRAGHRRAARRRQPARVRH